jgi:hypothetical protein
MKLLGMAKYLAKLVPNSSVLAIKRSELLRADTGFKRDDSTHGAAF